MQRTIILALMALLLVFCSIDAQENLSPKQKRETIKRLKKELLKNDRVLKWFDKMMPIWRAEEEVGMRSLEAISDSLESALACSKRGIEISDSIAILEGKDPNAWRKRPE